MLISCMSGYLPPACSFSFFTNATGGYPGGVLVRIRAAMDQGPGSSPLLPTGSSLHGGPQCVNNGQPRTYRSLCCTGYAATCQPGTLRMVMWRC